MLNFLPLFDESLEMYKKGHWLKLVTLASALEISMNLLRKRKRGRPFCPLCVDCQLVQRWPCSLVGLEPHGEMPSAIPHRARPKQVGYTDLEDFGGGQRAEACGETGAPEALGPREGRGFTGQRGALGACGRLATFFTLDQDTTSWVWEGPRQQGKANQRVRSPPLNGERGPDSGVSLSSTTWSCVGEGAVWRSGCVCVSVHRRDGAWLSASV